MKTRQIHCVKLIQSVIRRSLASKRVAELKEAKWQTEVAAATKIQTSWRSFYCSNDFMVTLGGELVVIEILLMLCVLIRLTVCASLLSTDIIICQSIIRRHIASSKAKALRQELKHAKNLLKILCNMKGLEVVEQTSAIKIASVLRGFRCRREYGQIKAGRSDD